jgi:hypothetical protein
MTVREKRFRGLQVSAVLDLGGSRFAFRSCLGDCTVAGNLHDVNTVKDRQ